ncbi:hypothetical protein OKA05_16960 [Luteolibacter arcticus]|uniref:DUF2326 domain-containing protein n=1 Tax=Luteolibacter arcticus TaxID=1581411 RepID=A0ABT3GL71_9BACT|nr:hypothetical protein [Luteolibacter arcticus]MCW1924259.1 hypothetical protein [Luteolibacter arcticus]
MNPPPSHTELQLTQEERPLSFTPLPGRDEPSIWVSKIGVFNDWKPVEDNKLRVFTLHRGLNILWANPEGANPEENRLSGHGAGKSTFCRLVRHLLNEDSAGTTTFLEGLRRHFDNPWLAGEVFICGERWLVGRPLSDHGHHSFAFKGESLDFDFPEKPPRQGFKDYQGALESAAFGNLSEKRLPDSQKELDWQRLLPWLSRDQEAHYSGLLEWRHKDSEHKSPVLSHDDRGHILRLVLGLLNSQERELLEKYARESEHHERKVRERPRKESIVQNDRERLSVILGGVEIPNPDEAEADLLKQSLDQQVKALRESVDLAPAKKRHEEEMSPLIKELDNVRASWAFADDWATDLEELIEKKEAELKGETLPKPLAIEPRRRDGMNRMMKGLGPFPGYCSHYMTDAWRANCRIAHERPADADEVVEAVKQIAVSPKGPKEDEIARDKVELARRTKIVADRKSVLDTIQSKVNSLRALHATELARINYPNQQAGQIETHLHSFKQSYADLNKWNVEIDAHHEEKQKLTAGLQKLSEQHDSAVRGFQRLYDHFAKQLLGRKVAGEVEIKAGKTIHPEIVFGGKRESAALKVTKWLAFDLAAMVFGFTNRDCQHPRFLIHDSPRESDLARSIYSAIFTTVHELALLSGPEPSFQYIITTTEAPPGHLNQLPWRLEPVLDSSTDTGRLLGINLENIDLIS